MTVIDHGEPYLTVSFSAWSYLWQYVGGCVTVIDYGELYFTVILFQRGAICDSK